MVAAAALGSRFMVCSFDFGCVSGYASLEARTPVTAYGTDPT
jgi:hypothetical protein